MGGAKRQFCQAPREISLHTYETRRRERGARHGIETEVSARHTGNAFSGCCLAVGLRYLGAIMCRGDGNRVPHVGATHFCLLQCRQVKRQTVKGRKGDMWLKWSHMQWKSIERDGGRGIACGMKAKRDRVGVVVGQSS